MLDEYNDEIKTLHKSLCMFQAPMIYFNYYQTNCNLEHSSFASVPNSSIFISARVIDPIHMHRKQVPMESLGNCDNIRGLHVNGRYFSVVMLPFKSIPFLLVSILIITRNKLLFPSLLTLILKRVIYTKNELNNPKHVSSNKIHIDSCNSSISNTRIRQHRRLSRQPWRR